MNGYGISDCIRSVSIEIQKQPMFTLPSKVHLFSPEVQPERDEIARASAAGESTRFWARAAQPAAFRQWLIAGCAARPFPFMRQLAKSTYTSRSYAEPSTLKAFWSQLRSQRKRFQERSDSHHQCGVHAADREVFHGYLFHRRGGSRVGAKILKLRSSSDKLSSRSAKKRRV